MMEIITGLIFAAIWIWVYLLFQTKLSMSSPPESVKAANSLEELSGSIAKQVSTAFNESSRRVTASFYVAIITIGAGAIMLISTILPFGGNQAAADNLQYVVGGFSSLLGSTLLVYYRSAAKQHQSLLNRALRLDGVMVFLAQLKEEPRANVRNRLRTQALDILLRLAVVKPGDPLPQLTFDEQEESDEEKSGGT
jgi:hypothetical protein